MSLRRNAGLAAAAALVVGWLAAPLPEEPAALVKPRQDVWRLPELPRRGDQVSTAAVVSGAPYWGTLGRAASAAMATLTPDPRWRIAALYGVGRERTVLVEFREPGKQPLQLRVGDKLPSGHPITAIEERELCIRIGARNYRMGVERSDS
jgi:hypothetical protein